MEKQNIILIDSKCNLIGQPVYTRWNKAKWYQKLLGRIYSPYKRKFIDVKGFEID